MTDWFVIADDLTGAAEIAGIAYQHGFSVKLVTGMTAFEHTGESMVVVNSGTRDLDPVQAAAKVRELLSGGGYRDEMRLYVKTDSLLRGNVGPELMALLSATSYASCLLVPANPSLHRVIRQGKYYVHNSLLEETEYRSDPDYPRTTSEVAALLAPGSEEEDTVQIDREQYGRKIMIPDVTSVDDVRMLIGSIGQDDVLPAGGSDFFRELLIAAGFSPTGTASLHKEYPVRKCFVFGSYAITNRKTIQTLQNYHYSVYELPVMNDNEEVKALDEDYRSAGGLNQNNSIPESCDPEATQDQRPVKDGSAGPPGPWNPGAGGNMVLKLNDRFVGDTGIREVMLEALANTAADVVSSSETPLHLLVTGGKTASLLCKKLNWNRLEPVDAFGTGVVTLREEESNQLLTVKPGSYDWPDFFLK